MTWSPSAVVVYRGWVSAGTAAEKIVEQIQNVTRFWSSLSEVCNRPSLEEQQGSIWTSDKSSWSMPQTALKIQSSSKVIDQKWMRIQTSNKTHKNLTTLLPFFKDLQSSDQAFEAKKIISIGRNINFIENGVRCTLCLSFTLFFTYDVFLRCLKLSKKKKCF